MWNYKLTAIMSAYSLQTLQEIASTQKIIYQKQVNRWYKQDLFTLITFTKQRLRCSSHRTPKIKICEV